MASESIQQLSDKIANSKIDIPSLSDASAQLFDDSAPAAKTSMVLAAPTWRERLARKIIFRNFNKMTKGRLIVREDGQEHEFGDPGSTHVVAYVDVQSHALYPAILLRGSIGAAESYMRSEWTSPSLTNVVRMLVLNLPQLDEMDSKWASFSAAMMNVGGLLKLNSVKGSKRNICAHYDLSNDFFETFLDPTMMYSSAIYSGNVDDPDTQSELERAAVFKVDHICQRLALNASDHLVEIGTGWGGMALHAAKNYGCKVTTTTISNEQYEYARNRVQEAGLGDRVTVLNKDYRLLEGTFDKLVSIEMVEAVGHQYYGQFFSKCASLLKENGLMLMQAITTPNQRFDRQKNVIDFIRKYIFPGGCLPSNHIIEEHIKNATDLHLVGLEDITLHYARTLKHWRERFFKNIDAVKALGFDDVFIRMWEFYLCYCEGGFQERVIGTSQFLYAKPGARNLPAFDPS